MIQTQLLRSIGGALNSAITAILLSDILFEPPFKENLWFQKESITAQITRQGRHSPELWLSQEREIPSVSKAKAGRR